MKEKNIYKYHYLIGTTIGFLTIQDLHYHRRGRCVDLMATCCCRCGTKKNIRLYSILSGETKSCGCKKVKHNLTGHRLHSVWFNMRNRCYNKKVRAYNRYGGRGIKVCDTWRTNFKTFYDWAMSHGWKPELELDRIDNNGDYSPENCRFVSTLENVHNREKSEVITYNGKTLHISEWAKIIGCSVSGLHNRIYRGWSIEKAIETPFKKLVDQKLLSFRGKTLNMHQWEVLLGLPRGTIANRIRIGWSIVRTLTTPASSKRK